MIITWIALGLAAGAAIAAIITYWNEIIDWATNLLDNLFQRGKLFLRWVNGSLIPKVKGIFNGRAETQEGKRKPATEEDIRKLYEEDVITYQEMLDLLAGKEISANR